MAWVLWVRRGLIRMGRPQRTPRRALPARLGPLNHFALQALVRLARVLRADPGSAGYLSAVSGILTKQGASVCSSEPGARPFAFDDVSEATARDTAAVAFVEDARGDATVASWTVLHEPDLPPRTVLLCDLPDGRRTFAQSLDPALAARGAREELCGQPMRLEGERVEMG